MPTERKLNEFRIEYATSGYGHCYIEAKNEAQAKQLFYDGEFERDDQNEEEEITEITKIPRRNTN